MRSVARVLIPAVIILGLAAGPTQAATDRLRIHLAAWPTELSGIQEVNGDVLAGTETDFGSVLGLSSETFPELHYDLKLLGPVRLVGSYFSGSFSGDQVLEESVTFDDVVYSVSEQVRSSVDLEMGKVALSFSVLNFKRLGLGLMVGANLVNLKSQLDSAISGSSQKDVSGPMPVVGVNLRLQPLKKLAIYAEVSGFSYDAGGVDATSLDGVVRVEYYLNPWIGITAGYRIIDLDVNDDDFGSLDFQQDGAQFGMVFRL
ncbi:MAG: hypothetical protein O7F16_05250 [Acidobacteria bacterium]|nr:hypothetical protein [Acidobacteriota bacterium]